MNAEEMDERRDQWQKLNTACRQKATVVVVPPPAQGHPLYSGVASRKLNKRLRVKTVFLATGWGRDSYGQRRGYSKQTEHLLDDRYMIRVICTSLDGRNEDFEFAGATVLKMLEREN